MEEETIGTTKQDETTKHVKSAEEKVDKSLFDKKVSEMSAKNKALAKQIEEYKEKLSSKMTEDEKKAQEQETLMQELETLKKEKTLANVKAGLLAGGYTAEEVENVVNNLESTSDLVNALVKIRSATKEQHEKELQKVKLVGTLRPGTDKGTQEVTAKEFDKMGYMQRLELKRSNPELYEKLSK